MKVEISEKFLNTLKQISLISPSILVTKDAETKKIQVGARNSAKSFFLSLEAPETEFTFQGENIGFLDFKEFVTIYGMFDQPSLEQDSNNTSIINISKMSTKIDYKLADSTTLPPYFAVPDFDTVDSVLITPDELGQISKVFQATGTSVLDATINGDKLELKFSGDQSLHEARDYINLEKPSTENSYSVTLMKDLLSFIPKGSYRMCFNPNESHIHLELLDEDYKLSMAIQSMV